MCAEANHSLFFIELDVSSVCSLCNGAEIKKDSSPEFPVNLKVVIYRYVYFVCPYEGMIYEC